MSDHGQSSCDAVRQLELDLLQPATRGDREGIERLLAEEFVEIGTSGERFSRDAVIAGLLAERADGSSPCRQVDHLSVVSVTDDVELATYRVRRTDPDGITIWRWRSSVWRLRYGHWRMVFHQGTPIASPNAAPPRST